MKTDNLTDAYHFGEAPDETMASSSTDCIYRADAEKAIADVISRGGTEAEILTEIHFLPTADVVEVRHGRWEFEDDDCVTWCTKAICSSCKQTVALNADLAQDWGKRLFLKDNLFCPKCGAKMDGGQDND